MNLEIVLCKDYDESIINQIYDIHSKKLGNGYLTIENICRSIKYHNVLIALNNKEVVGYLKFTICTEKQFFDNDNLQKKVIIKKY